MKGLRLPLLVLAALLGLAGCEYHNETETHVIPPQASAPDDATRLPATSTAAAPATAASAPSADATPAPAQPSTAAAAPEINAMGASPATSVPAPVASDGTAAQTELGRFLEENAIRQKAS